MKPKVVLCMDNPLIPTGYASTCRLTVRELTARGYDVYTIAFNGGMPFEKDGPIEWYGIKVIPNYALSRDPNAIYGDTQTILKIENDIKPDVFFFHNDSYRYSYLRDLPKSIQEKSVFWLPFEGTQKDGLGIQLFNLCAAARFVTKHAMDIHKDEFKGKDVGYIYHAVDTNAYKPPEDKRLAKQKVSAGLENKFVVARIDRHQPRKFWDLTLKAFAKFAKDKDDVKLMCKCNPRDVTMWNDRDKKGVDLEVLAQQLGITNKIEFNDFFFNGPSLYEGYYAPADVFLTTTSGEGFGLALAEAMSSGVPVICPDVPVLPEVCGEVGYLCPVAGKEWYAPLQVFYNLVDVDAAANRLEELYREWKGGTGKLEIIGKRAREIAIAKYNPKNIYDEWDLVLRKVSEKKSLVSIVTLLYCVDKEQLEGNCGIEKLKVSMENEVSQAYEWIIIDNGSPLREETRSWITKAAANNRRIKPIFLDTNLGFAGGSNKGIEEASGVHVLLLNPDSLALDHKTHGLPKDFVGMMMDKLQSDPDIGVLGMELHRRDDIMPGAMFPYFYCVMLTQKCLDAIKIGPNQWFDEAFWPAYYEDLDLTFRVLSKGFKIDGMNIGFMHVGSGTNGAIKKGDNIKFLAQDLEIMASARPNIAEWGRKRAEIQSGGLEGLIQGNINYLNRKWGPEARSQIKIVVHTHIGGATGFSQIGEGLSMELHKLGFDVYIRDWSSSGSKTNPALAPLIEKYEKAKEEGNIDNAIHLISWLMESFLDIQAKYKIGVALTESTRVRDACTNVCNSVDRILTFSKFCRKAMIDSGYTPPITIIPPGVTDGFLNYHERPINKKEFKFLHVGVSQERKDTYRLVAAFAETFPKHLDSPPESPDFPIKCKDVQLIVKSNNFGSLDWISQKGYDRVANIKIIYTGDAKGAQRPDYSSQEMYDLYCDADCYIHPAHGEGIGLPILESAATGCPVIFTNWSSPSEYLDETCSYPCSLSPYEGTTFTKAYPGVAGDNGLWANIHIGHMKFLMYTVVRERERAREKGKKAAEKIAKQYTWKEGARHLLPVLFECEEQRKKKMSAEIDFDPMTFVKPSLEPVKKEDRVMIDVVTRDRHPYLAALLSSLLCQSFKNWDIIIQVDDVDESILKDHQLTCMFGHMGNEGHGWNIIRSHRQGPHIAHARTLRQTLDSKHYKYKLICRVDDDLVLAPDYLENLFKLYVEDSKCEIGAAAGIYPHPSRSREEQTVPTDFESQVEFSGKVDYNVPSPFVNFYPPGTPPRRVEHLHCSYLYRIEVAEAIGGYCNLFSQVGHREETDFSHRFFLAGYKLLVNPDSVAYHYYSPTGGIRSGDISDRQKNGESDDRIYQRRLQFWKDQLRKKKEFEGRKLIVQKVPPDMQSEAPPPSSLADRLPPETVDSFAEQARKTLGTKKGTIAVVVQCGTDIKRTKECIDWASTLVDEIYVTSEKPEVKTLLEGNPKVKMVSTDASTRVSVLMAALQGECEFTMDITDRMKFLGNPFSLLSEAYDDYVFEVYQTYIENGLADKVGPELRNQCLIYRRRPKAKPTIERTLYSDIVVIEDNRIQPNSNGRSTLDNELLPLNDMKNLKWTKVCVFQFPEGQLQKPVYAEHAPEKKLDNMVSIIIPTAGRKPLLKKCIDSIYSHTTTPFELIIVDNASSDGTAEYLDEEEKRHSNLKVLTQGVNLGFQKAINIGVSKSKGKYLMLFNDDAWVKGAEPDGRDWLKIFIDELESDKTLGLVGPHGGESPALGIPMLYFWSVLLTRGTWDKIGPFDDSTFRNYGGDDDYCMRLKNSGFRIKEIPGKDRLLGHLMNCVPEHVKRPELEESRRRLKAKWMPA